MKTAADNNFLLTTTLSQRLYHECAQMLPIIDFHNHLNVSDIVNDRQYEDIAQLWLLGDPYKHRAMRICGVDEHYITGNADNFEKFSKWCETVPKLIGNPLYHWSHIELKKILWCDKDLCGENARYIWDEVNEKLLSRDFSSREILKRFNIEYSAPCCSITDTLSHFEESDVVSPSLRGDDMLGMSLAFISQLEKCTKMKIKDLADLKKAFSIRFDLFHQVGCRFSDHALDDGFTYFEDDGKNAERFSRIIQGDTLSKADLCILDSEILRFASAEYSKRGWVMQLHCGARRYTSSRLRSVAGPAGGFAAIGKSSIGDVILLLNDLEKDGNLPRTVIFTLNPCQNAEVSILSGSFNESGIPGKVQQGAAWWWCDHLGGIYDLFEDISAYSVLSTFIGMTTDSRSILSFVRHEYFRRLLCRWLGEKAEKGIFPDDLKALMRICENVCYKNAKTILGKE